jgi:hypothetical protein
MELQLYKVTDGAEHNEYLERVQALAYWFIEDVITFKSSTILLILFADCLHR